MDRRPDHQCPGCSKHFSLSAGAGNLVECPHCKRVVPIYTGSSESIAGIWNAARTHMADLFTRPSRPKLFAFGGTFVAALLLGVVFHEQVKKALLPVLLGIAVALTGGRGLKHIPEDALRAVPRGAASSALTRAHNKTCPSHFLALSTPSLDVDAQIAENLRIRAGPSQSYPEKNRFPGGSYRIDVLDTKDCWLRVRYGLRDSSSDTGWVDARFLQFSFRSAIPMPQDRLRRALQTEDLYRSLSGSVYMILAKGDKADSQGSAVAVSGDVLLTNCHVIDQSNRIYVMIDGSPSFALVVRESAQSDRCFLRTKAAPRLNPIPSVIPYSEIQPGQSAFSIGAPHGFERTINPGIVSGKPIIDGSRYVQTNAPISPGSSGGGLFDNKGNLLGITTFTIEDAQSLNFAIAAEDFWK